MKKVEMVKSVVSKVEGTTQKQVEAILKAYAETVKEGLLAGEEVPMVDGGKFVVVEKAERKCRNPKTGEEIIVPEHKAAKFKMGKELKDLFK